MELSEPSLIVEGGFLVARGKIARLDDGGAFPWITRLSTLKQIPFPDRERDSVMAKLLDLNVVPPLDVDEALKFEERRVQPRLGLRVTQQQETLGRGVLSGAPAAGLRARLDRIRLRRPRALVPRGARLPGARRRSRGRRAREAQGTRPAPARATPANAWRLGLKSMPKVVRELIHAGWHVEAEGKAFRRPGTTRVDVRTGIDWFELHGEVDYDGQTASLPAVAGGRAARRHHGAPGRRHLRPAARGVAGALRAAGRPGHEGRGPPALPAQPGGPAGCAAGGAARSARRRDVRAGARTHAHLHGREDGGAARGFRRTAARLPVRRPGLDGVPARVRLRRLPGGRHGRRQDGAGAGRAGIAAHRGSRPFAGGGAEIADVQLARRGGALHAAIARAGAHRPGARHGADRASTIWC